MERCWACRRAQPRLPSPTVRSNSPSPRRVPLIGWRTMPLMTRQSGWETFSARQTETGTRGARSEWTVRDDKNRTWQIIGGIILMMEGLGAFGREFFRALVLIGLGFLLLYRQWGRGTINLSSFVSTLQQQDDDYEDELDDTPEPN